MAMGTARLVAQAKAGDETAFRKLIDQHEGLLRGIASDYFLPGADDEDLRQEALIGLWKAVRGYDPSEGKFAPFAATCIRRHLITAVIAATRGKNGPMNGRVVVEDVDQEFADAASDPHEQISQREELQELVELAGEKLSGMESRTLAFFLSGYSYEEIGSRIGKDTKAVDNALTRCRRKLMNAVRAVQGGLRA